MNEHDSREPEVSLGGREAECDEVVDCSIDHLGWARWAGLLRVTHSCLTLPEQSTRATLGDDERRGESEKSEKNEDDGQSDRHGCRFN